MLISHMTYICTFMAVFGLLVACTQTTTDVAQNQQNGRMEYLKVNTRLMKPELVNMIVTMRNPGSPDDVLNYVQCAAAQYTLIRGYGFAGRVQYHLSEDDGIWAGNAVYTLSNAHPGGRHSIDAEVVVDDCVARNIPMV